MICLLRWEEEAEPLSSGPAMPMENPLAIVTLNGVPLSVQLQWPFHISISGADFYVLHGVAELCDGSGLRAQLSFHLTRVLANRLPGMEAPHTLGPVLGALREETDRKQLEFLRTDKRQPVALVGQFHFRTNQWHFEQATHEQIRQSLLDRLYWVGHKMQPGALTLADPTEALYLGTTVDTLTDLANGLRAEGLLRWVEGGALATEALLARSSDFEERARAAIEVIEQKHAFEQQKVTFRRAG